MPIWKIRLVYQDGKSYLNYISSCGSFSVDWSTCWPKMAKYCKNWHSPVLKCATLVKAEI